MSSTGPATAQSIVQKTLHEPLATLTIARPESMNALNSQVLKDLAQALEEVESDSGVRAVLLTGAGEKAFVAGADIKEIDRLSEAEAKLFAENGQKLMTRIENFKKPVIAVVNGFALGGGLELALACDFIWCSDKAKFGLPECSLGIMPGFGGSVRLQRRVGSAFALEVMMSGGFYSASEALAMGLVTRVWPAADLQKEAVQLAQLIASRAPLALAAIKRSVRQGDSLSVESAMRIEAQQFSELFHSSDQKEGTKAFIEKRKPNFIGR